MTASVVFGIIAVAMLASGVGVVRSTNLVHAVFWLAAMLIATAALFVLLDATFLAGIQVVLYTGGVVTLMLFAVMLTQHDPDTDIPNPAQRQGPAALVAGGMLAVLLAAIWRTPQLATLEPGPRVTPEDVGQLFLTTHVVAFEALSVLLLAAMIGAIVLARRRDA